MNHAEAAVQKAIVDALRLVIGRWYLVAHHPNHGFTNPGILTSIGMIPGAADLVITGAGFAGWLEVKDENGKQSKKQMEFQAECEARGIPYAVVRSVDEALAACVAWGIAARAEDGAVRSLRPPGLGPVERSADLPRRAGADLAGAVSEAPAASTGNDRNVTQPEQAVLAGRLEN